MRYLLQRIFESELSVRKDYLYDTIKLWTTISVPSDGFIHLNSIPNNCLDVLFLVGHNGFIKNYLKTAIIPEKAIVAITCDGKARFPKLHLPGKTLYISRQNENNYADLLRGSEFGFDFDLTESEILFYNTRKRPDVIERLNLTFTKL